LKIQKGSVYVVLAILILVIGCSKLLENQDITTQPFFETAISDAVHDNGSENFYFLPPMVPAPDTEEFGQFNTAASPEVKINEWNGTEYGLEIASFSTTTGTGEEVLRVNSEDELYIVNWHTDGLYGTEPVTYRIRVFANGDLLGFADVVLVENGKAAKNLKTEEVIPLVDGRTLPIKFRIELTTTKAITEFNIGDAIGIIDEVEHTVELTVPYVDLADLTPTIVHTGASISPASGVAQDFTNPVIYTVTAEDASTQEYVVTVTPTVDPTSVIFVSAGGYHSMIIRGDGTLWATGRNNYGQLGDGTTTFKSTPVQVMSDVSNVSAGYEHTMIVKTDGTLWATGRNNFGELGDGTTTNKLTPIQVMSDVSFVDASWDHTMILKNDGTLWATGFNMHGELGDGTKTNKSTPVQVMSDVASVSAGTGNYAHTMILKTDGTLWATGWNYRGQLGDGTLTDKKIPVQVMSDVSSVSAGGAHTMILKIDGTLLACGRNDFGQLGDGTTDYKVNPVQIMSDVASVSASRMHTAIVKMDGTLWTTGYNNYGQLADGTQIDKSIPEQVMSSVSFVSAGFGHIMMIKDDKSLWGVGYGGMGQLGDGHTTSRLLPVPIIW
jgi:alpha-tubulin suppressor-like RCC1 family protein